MQKSSDGLLRRQLGFGQERRLYDTLIIIHKRHHLTTRSMQHGDDLGVRLPPLCVGESLAEWIARSDMSAVHLNIRGDYAYARKGAIDISVRNLGRHSALQKSADAPDSV